MQLSSAYVCASRVYVCVRGFTFRKSPGLSLQRLEAAAVLIDGLHLRIFVPRQRVSRIAAEKTGFTFSGNTGNHDGCPSASNDADGGAAQATPFAVSLP